MIDHSRLRMAADGRLQKSEAAAFECLRKRVAAGEVRFVASLVHLWEIARHGDRASNEREGQLIDSMRPVWAKLRVRLIEEELLNAFHAWRGEHDLVDSINPFLVSPSAYSVSLIIVPGQDSASVQRIWLTPKTRETVMNSISPYVRNQTRLIELQKQQPNDVKRSLENAPHEMARRNAPVRDRRGNFTKKAERELFASQFKVNDSPSMHVEQAMVWAKVRRGTAFKVELSEAMDTMYAESTLAYVDVVVLDRHFTELVRQATQYWPGMRGRCFADISKALDYLDRLPK